MNQQTNAPVTNAIVRKISQPTTTAKGSNFNSDIRNYENYIASLLGIIESQQETIDFLTSVNRLDILSERKEAVIKQF